MTRRRYEGYVALRDAIARQALADYPTAVLADLAEGLLVARDEKEARGAAASVADSLVSFVARGELSWFAAHRSWALLQKCGPRLGWPTWWDHPMAESRPSAVRGR